MSRATEGLWKDWLEPCLGPLQPREAWDTLCWLIEKGGDVVVDALWTLLERDFTPDVQNFPLVGIPSHGLPSKNQAFSLLQNAYHHVVLPNLKIILEEKMVQLAV